VCVPLNNLHISAVFSMYPFVGNLSVATSLFKCYAGWNIFNLQLGQFTYTSSSSSSGLLANGTEETLKEDAKEIIHIVAICSLPHESES